MSSPVVISPEERIIVALACLIGVSFLLLAPHSCKPGATAFSLSSMKSSSQKEALESTRATSQGRLAKKENTQHLPLAASSKLNSNRSDFFDTTSKHSAQSARTQTLVSSSNKLPEATALGATTNPSTGASPAQNQTPVPAQEDRQEETLLTEKLRIQNEDFLLQIEKLAQESNALKEERRERLAQFSETKNEYDATLKFARDQQQEQLIKLQEQNQMLVEKLAALSEPGTLEAPLQEELPAPNPSSTEETPSPTPSSEEEMPAPAPSSEEEQPVPASSRQSEEAPQAPAFAQSDDDLDKNRQVLVNAIRDMDALSGDPLASRYQKLESEIGTISAGRIRFVSGSSQAGGTELAKIEKIAEASKGDTQFLIVGFADRTGSADGNRKLSSKRARFVAEQLGKKVGNARVQAVYIGQTARFGPAAENRVVEIWQIPATSPQP